MARAMRGSGERNPNATRVLRRILVLMLDASVSQAVLDRGQERGFVLHDPCLPRDERGDPAVAGPADPHRIMQVSAKVDYGLRAMLELAARSQGDTNDLASAEELAEAQAIPGTHEAGDCHSRSRCHPARLRRSRRRLHRCR